MKKLLAVALIATMVTGCGTHQRATESLEKARAEHIVRLENAMKVDLERTRQIQEINHRRMVENRIADEQDKKSLREKGYVVCEKYSTYSACK